MNELEQAEYWWWSLDAKEWYTISGYDAIGYPKRWWESLTPLEKIETYKKHKQ